MTNVCRRCSRSRKIDGLDVSALHHGDQEIPARGGVVGTLAVGLSRAENDREEDGEKKDGADHDGGRRFQAPQPAVRGFAFSIHDILKNNVRGDEFITFHRLIREDLLFLSQEIGQLILEPELG